jgi:hypothetical protein
MAQRPLIGDFRSPSNNAPRTDAPPPAEETLATPAPEAAVAERSEEVNADAAKEATEEVLKEIEEEAKMTPAERYRKRLEKAKIDINTARAIFDAVLAKGHYEEYIYLGKKELGKRATLRTRLYEDTLRLQTQLELTRPVLGMTQDDLVTRYNLAASLVEWNGKPLKHETDEEFDAVVKLLHRLPAPVYGMLAQELAKFDRKTMIVFSEGAVENFS